MQTLSKAYSLLKKRVQYSLYFFIGFIVFVFLIKRGFTSTIDIFFFNKILAIRTAALDEIMEVFTFLGDIETLLVLTLITAFVLFIRHRWDMFVVLITAFGFSSVFVWISKILIARTRPEKALAVIQETGFSLPSGHALMGLVFYGLLTYIIYTSILSKTTKKIIIYASMLLILLLGLSRIYLGVHWISDIVAGYLAGTAILLLFIGLLEFLKPAK